MGWLCGTLVVSFMQFSGKRNQLCHGGSLMSPNCTTDCIYMATQRYMKLNRVAIQLNTLYYAVFCKKTLKQLSFSIRDCASLNCQRSALQIYRIDALGNAIATVQQRHTVQSLFFVVCSFAYVLNRVCSTMHYAAFAVCRRQFISIVWDSV